jgi:UTP:GlnB (protein PII) uridylyltransferase
LVLTVRARDRMGFLASLLEHLAGLVLFPEEIRIDTFQNEAHDVLWLSSVGGQSPAPEIEAALRASLAGCTRQRASMRPST